MYCHQCGTQVDYKSSSFCPSCGAKLSGEEVETYPIANNGSELATKTGTSGEVNVEDEQNPHSNSGGNSSNSTTPSDPSEENFSNPTQKSVPNGGIAGTREEAATGEGSGPGISQQMKGTFLQATEKINSMVGEQGNIDLNLRDVFSAVFKKHSKQEAETLFISGTQDTTPAEHDIPTSWPRPWLFARVFFILAITYILLYVSTFGFENLNALPGLIMVGSFAVPFSLLIFFWETNAPRNISMYEIVKMLFVGGAASLVITLFLFAIFPVYDLDFTSAVIVGITEEMGKLAIVAYFIYKLNTKYILNGLLIGATIGAGFAAFESAGYAFNYWYMYGDQMMVSVIFSRAWMAIGTHAVWAAISGAALAYVKGASRLTSDHFFNAGFLKLFVVPVLLHAFWNMPLDGLHQFYFKYIVLIVIAWIFIFTFINAGLKQIGRLNSALEKTG